MNPSDRRGDLVGDNPCATRPNTAPPSGSPLGSPRNSSDSIISFIERKIASISQWLKDNSPGATEVSQDVTAVQNELAQLRLIHHEPQSIHEKLDRILSVQTAQQSAPAQRSWAAVASLTSSTPSSYRTQSSQPAESVRLTIRPGENSTIKGDNITTKEVAEKVKAVIPGVVAARVLPSGDVRVTLENPSQKERATLMPGTLKQQLDAKIIKEDFPIEVLGVPTSLPVQHGREADNSETIKKIKQSTERIIPGFEVSRVAWIHGKKSLQPRRDGRVPQAASLIIYTTKEEYQKMAIRRGVVIDYTLYTTKLYDPGLQLTLCFRCNHWGHTQAMCRSRTNCGYCAQGHSSRECPHRADPTKAKCCNCGNHGHAAWQATKCPAYKKCRDRREQLRAALAIKEYRWAEEAARIPTTPEATNPKRAAPSSDQNGQRKRSVGRPSFASLHGYTPSASQPSIVQFAGTVDYEIPSSQPSGETPPSSNAE